MVQAARKLLKIATSSAQKASAMNAMVQADLLYNSGWTYVWSFPSVILECDTLPDSCVTTTENGARIESVVSASKQLQDLLLGLTRRYAKAGGNARTAQSLNKRARDMHNGNVSSAATIPVQTVRCG